MCCFFSILFQDIYWQCQGLMEKEPPISPGTHTKKSDARVSPSCPLRPTHHPSIPAPNQADSENSVITLKAKT